MRLTLVIDPSTAACGSTDLSRGAEVAGFLRNLANEVEQEGFVAALTDDDADWTPPVVDSAGVPMGTAILQP